MSYQWNEMFYMWREELFTHSKTCSMRSVKDNTNNPNLGMTDHHTDIDNTMKQSRARRIVTLKKIQNP